MMGPTKRVTMKLMSHRGNVRLSFMAEEEEEFRFELAPNKIPRVVNALLTVAAEAERDMPKI